MYKFYKLCLMATGTVHPPPETWDMLDTTIRPPENIGLLKDLMVLPRSVRAGQQPLLWYILKFGDTHSWSLALSTAADIITVCQISPSVGLKHATHLISPDDIISFLVNRGVPFQTFQSTTAPSHHVPYWPTPTQLPRKPVGYQFTKDNYLQYQHTRDLMLSTPRMRAALLRGGII